MTTSLRKSLAAISLAVACLLPLAAFAQSAASTTPSISASSTADATGTDEAADLSEPVSGGTDGSTVQASDRGDEGQYERAVIERVDLKASPGDNGTVQQVKVYHVLFRSGPLDGQEADISSDVGSNPYNIDPHQGDTVVIFMQPDGSGGWLMFLEGYDRRAALFFLAALFVLTLVLLSGWQGVKVAISMAISVGLIAYVLIPLFLRGANPVPVAIVLAGIFTYVSAGLTTGWNRKAIVTAVGTMGGALVAYFISVLFVDWSRMSGLSTDEDRLFFDKNPNLDPRGFLFAGIIIAAVGVLEDVAVSIASGVSEVARHKPHATFRELFVSGMVVGRDHMGALANTLVFAYVGSSLSTLLLYSQFGGSWLKFINFDSVVDEVVRSLAGTIGLVFTVPITALLAAWITVASRPVRHREQF
ncbi:MAG TPA: YibE/F family protein [Verrucomicrobiae bacterium]|nr:YibE/F family protein [Verrucomicrobiae bacterium]